MKTLISWINKVLSDVDGIPDEARLAAMLLVIGYIGLSAYDLIWLKHPWNPQEYGIGAGGLAAGVGGWMGFRGKN
jgi:hypothetical protein